MTNDLVNGLFQLIGGVLCWANAARLYRDKVVHGVVWQTTAFFSCWGLWNLWYFTSLEQWLSFAAGAFLAAGNIAWVVLAVYYKGKQ